LLLGYSYRLDAQRTLNLSLGAGLTADTPDVQLTLAEPITALSASALGLLPARVRRAAAAPTPGGGRVAIAKASIEQRTNSRVPQRFPEAVRLQHLQAVHSAR